MNNHSSLRTRNWCTNENVLSVSSHVYLHLVSSAALSGPLKLMCFRFAVCISSLGMVVWLKHSIAQTYSRQCHLLRLLPHGRSFFQMGCGTLPSAITWPVLNFNTQCGLG
eukprot:2444841-Amphidinium_carterae.2